MFWLTWRQFRRPALATLAGLGLLAAVLLPSGLAMRHTFDRLGLARCTETVDGHVTARMQIEGCPEALTQFHDRYGLYTLTALLLVAVPLLLGLFWGPGLIAAETEFGTHRFAWTQGVSRRYWAAVRFGLVGGFVTVLAIGLALAVDWWWEPVHRSGDARLVEVVFDVQGVASVGYTLFAVALGLLAGGLLRRTGPATAATLVGYLAVRIAVVQWARPRFLPPHVVTTPRAEDVDRLVAYDDWTVLSAVKDASGRILNTNGSVTCAPGSGCGDLARGTYNWVLFQPASRFWTFQWIETGLFTALALGLVLVALRRVRTMA